MLFRFKSLLNCQHRQYKGKFLQSREASVYDLCPTFVSLLPICLRAILTHATADMFRTLFKFGVFNAVQSTCFDTVCPTLASVSIPSHTITKIMSSNENLVRSTSDSSFHLVHLFRSTKGRQWYALHPCIIMSSKSFLAPTGSGKTVLFELAIIHMLTRTNSAAQNTMKCVYMAPTKVRRYTS